MRINTRFPIIVKVIGILLLLNAKPLLAAFAWPWDPPMAQKARSSNDTPVASSSAPVTSQPESETLSSVQTIEPEAAVVTKEVLPKPTSASPQKTSTDLPQPAAIVPNRPSRMSIQSSYTIKAPQRNDNYEEAIKLQARLNAILKLSAQMEQLNRSKVIEIQTMVDKARKNQQLLTRLASPIDGAAKIGKGDIQQILLTKKLRGLREEAEKQVALAQSSKAQAAPAAGRKTV